MQFTGACAAAATLIASCLTFGQNRPFTGMRYLGEIGHLETEEDHRTTAELVIAKAVSENRRIHIEGADDRGRPWTAAIQIVGGVGWTDTWIGDFDGNSRQDLLIAAFFPPSGRCLDPVHLTFLMMDSAGRPVPWTVDSRWPKNPGEGKRPALLVDFNGNGRAELMTTDCQYRPGPGLDEDRRITGTYEAKDAHWQEIHPVDMARYLALFRATYHRSGVHLLPPKEADATNLGNAISGASNLTLTEVRPPSPECGNAVNVSPVFDGRHARLDHNPCAELRYTRLMFSDGSTCYADGGMTVVFDRSEGREIVEGSGVDELRKLMTPGFKITRTGQTIAGKCSPAMLWATGE